MDEIRLNCDGQPVRYSLASCAANVGNVHARSYLKDKASGKWVQFDDAQVTPLAELTQEHKKKISVLYYQKL